MDIAAPGRIRRQARILFDYSRGRQALLSVAQPALGALLAGQAFPGARVTLLGLLAATAGFLAVFSLNDLLDMEADREALLADAESSAAASEAALAAAAPRDLDVAFVRHPLAHGMLSYRTGVAWVSAFGVIGLASAYFLRPLCAVIFVACVVLEWAYCSLKHRSWLKTAPAGVMVGLGGFAGWVAVGHAGTGAVLFFLLLVVWEIAGRNLSNDLADRDLDSPLGIRTVATTFGGSAAAKWILLGSVAILPLAYLQPGGLFLKGCLVIAAAITMTLPAIRLVLVATPLGAQAYFNQASLFPPIALALTALALVLPAT